MKETLIILIGCTVAVLSAVTMLPQIIKSIRTKNVQDISMLMLVMYMVNAGLWVAYGFLIGSWPLLWADGMAFLGGSMQFFIKLKYQNGY